MLRYLIVLLALMLREESLCVWGATHSQHTLPAGFVPMPSFGAGVAHRNEFKAKVSTCRMQPARMHTDASNKHFKILESSRYIPISWGSQTFTSRTGAAMWASARSPQAYPDPEEKEIYDWEWEPAEGGDLPAGTFKSQRSTAKSARASPPRAPSSLRVTRDENDKEAETFTVGQKLNGSKEWDWAVRLVEGNAEVRRMLAFPVAFASSANWLAECIYVATKLKVPDALAHGPKTIRQLAEEVDANGYTLARLIRSLSGQGPIPGLFIEVHDTPLALLPIPLFPPLRRIFKAPKSDLDRKYALTPMGAMLREHGTGTLRPWVLFSGEELGKAWSGLLVAVREGRPNFGTSQGGLGEDGMTFWEFMDLYPEKRETFDASMQALSAYSTYGGEAAQKYDWTRRGKAKWIVDVGGGTGRLLGSILRREPSLRGTLFDQQSVIESKDTEFILRQEGVEKRCERVAGSFFDDSSIPAGADVYVMKNIVHDWEDEASVEILKKVREAMLDSSRLVLLEVVRSERVRHETWNMDFADFFDLNMLVTVGGKERSESEFRDLFEQCGLRLVSVTRGAGQGSPCAIEAEKV